MFALNSAFDPTDRIGPPPVPPLSRLEKTRTIVRIWFVLGIACSPALAAKAQLSAKPVMAQETQLTSRIVACSAGVRLPAKSSMRCAGNFPDFLVQFEKSVAFQSRYTRFPVHFTYVDGSANPEPETHSVKIVSPADAKYEGIVFPSPATQARIGLHRELIPQAAGAKIIRLYKPDSDYVISYFFLKSGDCWKLAKVDNASL